ncbi:MAG: hypothetical protein WD767_15500 [Alphaproteobacteria bacterium]
MSRKFCHGLVWLTVAYSVSGQEIENLTFFPMAHATLMIVSGSALEGQVRFPAVPILERYTFRPQENPDTLGRFDFSDSRPGTAFVSDNPRIGVGDMVLGGPDLIELVAGSNANGIANVDSDFNIDPVTLTDRQNLWSDIAFTLEIDELLDFSATAVAGFIPEIRFWLEGNRWGNFGSSLNEFQVVGGFKYGSVINNGTLPDQVLLHSNLSGNSTERGASGTSAQTEARSRSLSEFASDIFFKLIRLPITYVILFTGLTILAINLNRQPRT